MAVSYTHLDVYKRQRSGRSARALESYQEALAEKDLEKNEIGRIYHNIGIAESKLFRFQNAKIAFIKAYQHLRCV